jgi:uncharacterized LabA/DUF88 family protein
MLYHAHCFVDGAYLRRLADDAQTSWVNPRVLANNIVISEEIQTWGRSYRDRADASVLTRVVYYDARPDDDSSLSPKLREYWEAVELLPDTELGFGSLRGGIKKGTPRQKGVDTLIAVDMLVGAFTKIFSIAVLIAGDGDFVPVVNEVRRRGVMVVVAADDRVSDDLRRAADRFFRIGPGLEASRFPSLSVNGKSWGG